jgi:hypothetical protein
VCVGLHVFDYLCRLAATARDPTPTLESQLPLSFYAYAQAAQYPQLQPVALLLGS